jgi:hypothetical protein
MAKKDLKTTEATTELGQGIRNSNNKLDKVAGGLDDLTHQMKILNKEVIILERLEIAQIGHDVKSARDKKTIDKELLKVESEEKKGIKSLATDVSDIKGAMEGDPLKEKEAAREKGKGKFAFTKTAGIAAVGVGAAALAGMPGIGVTDQLIAAEAARRTLKASNQNKAADKRLMEKAKTQAAKKAAANNKAADKRLMEKAKKPVSTAGQRHPATQPKPSVVAAKPGKPASFSQTKEKGINAAKKEITNDKSRKGLRSFFSDWSMKDLQKLRTAIKAGNGVASIRAAFAAGGPFGWIALAATFVLELIIVGYVLSVLEEELVARGKVVSFTQYKNRETVWQDTFPGLEQNRSEFINPAFGLQGHPSQLFNADHLDTWLNREVPSNSKLTVPTNTGASIESIKHDNKTSNANTDSQGVNIGTVNTGSNDNTNITNNIFGNPGAGQAQNPFNINYRSA